MTDKERSVIKENLIEKQNVDAEIDNMHEYALSRVTRALTLATDIVRFTAKYAVLKELGEDYVEYVMRQLLVSPFIIENQLSCYLEKDEEVKDLIRRVRGFEK